MEKKDCNNKPTTGQILGRFFSLYFGAYFLTWGICIFTVYYTIVFTEGVDLLGLLFSLIYFLPAFPLGVFGLIAADIEGPLLLLLLVLGYAVYLSILIMLLKRYRKAIKNVIAALIFILIFNMVGCIYMASSGAFMPSP